MADKSPARPSSSSAPGFSRSTFYHSGLAVKVKACFGGRAFRNVSSSLNEHFRRCVDGVRYTVRFMCSRLSRANLPLTTKVRVISTMGQDEGWHEGRKNVKSVLQGDWLMRPKVEGRTDRCRVSTRYFKAPFTGQIDLIEGIARNEKRTRSASQPRRIGRSIGDAHRRCSRVAAFRISLSFPRR